jgi:hypothetical protein
MARAPRVSLDHRTVSVTALFNSFTTWKGSQQMVAVVCARVAAANARPMSIDTAVRRGAAVHAEQGVELAEHLGVFSVAHPDHVPARLVEDHGHVAVSFGP